MFFNFAPKREIQYLKEKKQELIKELVQAKKDITDLTEKMTLLEEKQKRIEFLLNERIPKRCNFIQRTKKGVEILTSIKYNPGFEIEIFDLENTQYNQNRSLWMVASLKPQNTVFINNIEGGKGLGHGQVAMDHLIEFAIKNECTKIMGELSPADYDHKDRLYAFYSKFDFSIRFGENNKRGYIEKSL